MKKQQIGVIGLAVMGKNLALNIVDHGYSVAVYNRTDTKIDELLEEAKDKDLLGCYSLEEFTKSLEIPRKIILMVKAGEAVDATINMLLPYLTKDDIIMDGGNSYYLDTIKRSKQLREKGLYFLGTGISGGEEGARKGPAIMPGGAKEAYDKMEPILTAISAKVGAEACSTYIGENGAGHFVKMVHNGIEYADMQLISEAYSIMKHVLGLAPEQLHDVFEEWNQGELNSYLIEITAKIFEKREEDGGGYLVDQILDVAGQKGTGKWTGQVSLDLGAPTPTITTAVYERYLSAMKEERMIASKALSGTEIQENKKKEFVEAIRKALYASKICAYAQGFGLLKRASKEYEWDLSYGEIAKIFRGGCIIRAQFLNQITLAYEKNPKLVNLLLEDYFRNILNLYQKEWRETVTTAINYGIPVPGFSSALAYYDSYRSEELPMNLLQAQRDFFGAHTYERKDQDGTFHTKWEA
jgi:6-phosphogluconate dehydrogenase